MKSVFYPRRFSRVVGCLFIIISLITVLSCDEDLFVDDPNRNVTDNIVSSVQLEALLNEVSITNSARKYQTKKNVFDRKVEKIETLFDNQKQAALYVVNYFGGGFLIMPADKRANPIMAFSETSNLPVDMNALPPGMREWIDYSKEYIQKLRKDGKKPTELQTRAWKACEIMARIVPPGEGGCGGTGGGGTGGGTGGGGSGGGNPPWCQEEFEEVRPLTQTKWGQGCGYNAYNPFIPNCNPDNCHRHPTGCVATAMAQVMKYHSYPQSYNWSIMPNSISNFNSPQTMEIARLMRNIGIKVKMDYGCAASGADSEDEIDQSFKSDFGYSSAKYLQYEETSRYDIVVAEIKAGRPVIFRGGEKVGLFYRNGHAWVGDGFRRIMSWNEDCSMGWGYLYFHMNWGWDGAYYDTWFGFNDFTPGSGSYNYKSGVVVYIKP